MQSGGNACHGISISKSSESGGEVPLVSPGVVWCSTTRSPPAWRKNVMRVLNGPEKPTRLTLLYATLIRTTILPFLTAVHEPSELSGTTSRSGTIGPLG